MRNIFIYSYEVFRITRIQRLAARPKSRQRIRHHHYKEVPETSVTTHTRAKTVDTSMTHTSTDATHTHTAVVSSWIAYLISFGFSDGIETIPQDIDLAQQII